MHHETLMQTQTTVRELMRLESQQALEDLRTRRGARGRGAASVDAVGAGHSGDALQLLGIYGVGSRLYAEVRVGERVLRFRKGKPGPLGRPDAEGAPQLQEVVGSCARMTHRGEEALLCLPQRGDE